ncbi:MAG: bifunctional (p)ppGpp synthetase/guanosine-3',5'-bis(diphosphate) 3'-pyrophosphohydrolase [Bdellovibrionales bacterium]|nr:bifunctional (p)ppGpp synthetase/guanosine-3',5'-bis(diphosphate) 3'-pyrophosphohydrolase [Bdellovibrionales bacterium]
MEQSLRAAPAVKTIENLSEKIRFLGLEVDTDVIHTAYQYSKKAHEGQKRQSGEPYISHPLSVAEILVNLQMDQESIVTALLHDVVEDTPVTIEDIKKEFGSNVSFLVDGVTKISRMNFQNLHHKQSENIRKMIVAMGKDVRVILVKLADRLHNLRTLEHLTGEKQVRIAEETLEVYAPLASRLGMNSIKTEMEDLSFKYFNPQASSALEKKMSETEEERGQYMEEVIHQLDEQLKKFMKTKYEIQGRYKNFYSIYRKMTLQNLTFEQIPDILGFRVCVNKTHECYEVLGLVHSFWKPVPGRFKDFIALPKINNYQSLHTTVIGPRGRQIEVQIRTLDMHFMAENGIASHWIYKLGTEVKRANVKKTLEKVNWLKSMVSWNQQVSDSGEFLENVKLDLFESEIYVLTPTGEIKEFPKGATPIDFAFSIHTDVGSTMRAARVNSRQVPLKYKLQSGDVVEITTSKKQKPSKDWLKFCVTSRARSKIKQFIKTEERKKALEIGGKLMEKGYQTFGISEKELLSHPLYERFMKENGLNNKEDLLISLGFGKILFKNLFRFIMKPEKDPLEKGQAPKKTSSKSLIAVEGADHIMVHFAKCCHPVSGDSIKGYISRKKGIVIHRAECFILGAVSSERFVDVAWKRQTVPDNNYSVTLQALCVDEPGTLNKLSEAFTFFGLNIYDIRIHRRQDLKAFITFSTKVKDVSQMNALITRLRKINDVIHVSRELMDPRN